MSKNETLNQLVKKCESIIDGETNLIANLANISALIKEDFHHLWVGFYLVDKEKNQLVLGPFQGPVACTRIPYDEGVCGKAWSERKTQVVDNVHEFPGHIACSSLSNSEIVVPIFKGDEVFALLDIDSVNLSTFDDVDQEYFEKLAAIVSKTIV